MEDAGRRARDGDLGPATELLTAQALSLNAIFTRLMHHAHTAALLEHSERYARLALKAQNQCRVTVEALAAMRGIRIFTKQANISSGPQQVNNTVVSVRADSELTPIAPNELLEEHGHRLESVASSVTEGHDSTLETVGSRDGAEDDRREGALVSERLARR